MKCPVCGTKINEEKECPSCGADFKYIIRSGKFKLSKSETALLIVTSILLYVLIRLMKTDYPFDIIYTILSIIVLSVFLISVGYPLQILEQRFENQTRITMARHEKIIKRILQPEEYIVGKTMQRVIFDFGILALTQKRILWIADNRKEPNCPRYVKSISLSNITSSKFYSDGARMSLTVQMGKKKRMAFIMTNDNRTKDIMENIKKQTRNHSSDIANIDKNPIKWRCIECGAEIPANQRFCEKHGEIT